MKISPAKRSRAAAGQSDSPERAFSSQVVDGAERAASRAMLYAVGFKADDFKKPQVGVVSTWSQVTPCNIHIDQLAVHAALGINDAGQIVGTGVNPNGQRRAFLLTPLTAPRFSFAGFQTGQFRLTLVGEAGRSDTIQASTNLVNWTDLTNFVSATGTNEFTDPAAPDFPRRFYRAVAP